MFECVLTDKVLGCNNKVFQTNKWMFFLCYSSDIEKEYLAHNGYNSFDSRGNKLKVRFILQAQINGYDERRIT